MLITPAFQRLKREDSEFQASMDYIVSLRQAHAT